MKNKKLHLKKVFRFALLVMLLCAARMTKCYAYDFSAVCETGQTLYYNITNAAYHYVELTRPGNYDWNGYDRPIGNVIIPKYVYDADDNQYLVTTIGGAAFSNCSGLTSITIPNSVTSIGETPFFGCNGIEEILVESGNTIYDSRENCNAIIRTSNNTLIMGCKNTVIPNTVTSIGRYAFYTCTGLTSIEIPNSVISIDEYAFRSCTGLTSIEIPSSVTSIGTNPFTACSGLEQIVVASDNAYYDSRENCNAVVRTSTNTLVIGCKNTVIPSSVISIGDRAFMECNSLTSIEIPDFITWLGFGAFLDCRGLTTVTIGNSVPEIQGFTFSGCNSLTSITIGNSVASIGTAAFQGWGAIKCIYALPEVPPLINDSYFYVSSSIPVYVPCGAEENYQVANGWSSFTNIIGLCSGEVEVIVDPFEGGTVTGAGYYSGGDVCVLTATPNSGFAFAQWIENGIVVSMDPVFSFYAHPTTIMAKFVPDGNIVFADANVKSLCVTNWDTNGDGELSYVEAAAVADLGNVFNSYSQITSFDELHYFTGLSSIDDYSFSGCIGLNSIEIPSSVTSIGRYAFYGSGLTLINIPNSVTAIGDHAFSGCSRLTSITIPNSITSIGDLAFQSCWRLSSLTIGNSVTSIGSDAFLGCSGLEYILVESGNTVYDSRDNCNAIIHTSTNEVLLGCKNTVIPNSVTSIGSDAFYGCSGLTLINIPNSVTSIGSDAFYGCSGLTLINIPNSVTSIGGSAFSGCSGLEHIVVESGNSVYDSRDNCNAIIHTITNELILGCKNTIIPNSVTTIGDSAFYGCSGLTSVTIPNSVTTIGSHAFFRCSGLSLIIMLSITPPTLESSAFSVTSNMLKIYVPYESLVAYKTATNWSNYQSIIFPWLQRSISGYGTGNGKWHFIASPLITSVAPTEINGMIQESDYDLYRFNQSAELEWENYKNPVHTEGFTINNGKGYLYASKEDVVLLFISVSNDFDERMVNLAYDANSDFAGWNLVGNPFPVQAYANRSYYVMNEDGSAIEPVAVSSEVAIEPCTGVMVKAEASETNPKVSFSKMAPDSQVNQGVLQIAVAQNNTRGNTVLDKTIVSFNEGDALGKFVFNEDNAKLWIPCGEDFAIVCAEKTGEMPLNFEAKEDGVYTISVNPENVEMDYLHLIDNLTGVDVDLLQTPEYTFDAKKSDYASRFKLVFATNEENGPSTGSGTFAFYNGNEWVVSNTGEATLQIVDMMGRVLSSEPINGNATISLNQTPGVYMLRLVSGDSVQVQKVVVR